MISLPLRHTALIIAFAASVCAGSAKAQSNAPSEGLTQMTTYLDVPEEAPLAGVFVRRNIAYVGGHSTGYFTTDNIGVRLVDLSDPVNPQLISRIPIRQWHLRRPYAVGSAVAGDLDTEHFKGTIAVVTNGVPDTYTLSEYMEPHGVWDVTDPADPKLLGLFGDGRKPFAAGSDIGEDYPKKATAIAGNYYYYLFAGATHQGRPDKVDVYVGIVDLSDPRHPVQVGTWQDSTDIWMAGISVNDAGTRAYISADGPKPRGLKSITSRLYLLDVSDPTAPTELGRWEMPARDGGNSLSSAHIARATADDNLVIFVDGSWGEVDENKHGILHVLDVSDPSNIVKISEFDANAENPLGYCCNTAVNVTIRGSTVYSAWVDGGVVATDISDPANPIMTGQFIADQIMDAVPLGDEYVVAGPAWREGLYIIRDENTAKATASETDRTVPGTFVLHQNYPNPFNTAGAGTQISFDLPEATSIRLAVFDVTGKEVAVLVNETLGAGRHTVRFAPDRLPGGIYLYRLRTASFETARRAVVVE